MIMQQWQNWGVILGVILTSLGIITVAMKWTRRLAQFGRRVMHFLDQWNGEPARDGQPARDGVPARLAALEEGQRNNQITLNTVVLQVRDIKSEFRRNGHRDSLKDAMDRVEGSLGTGQQPHGDEEEKT